MSNDGIRDIPHLSTRRLALRPLEKRDADAYFDLFSDVETMRYWSGRPVRRFNEAEDLLRRDMEGSDSGTSANWGITMRSEDRLIGKFTLFQISTQNRRAEVGYILARRFWKNGYMSEVMETVLDFAFRTLSLHRLEADTDPENAGSLALLEKFGFRREGLFRERWNVGGKWLDSVMLGLLETEYQKR